MADDEVSLDRQIEASLGRKQAALLKANACTRVCGLLTAAGRSGQWEEAFKHISLHFGSDPSKPSHSGFAKRYRDKEVLRELIKRAASAPSTVQLTKLNIDGRPVGREGVKIVRRFGESVGESPEMVFLVIITDAQGKLITAYPSGSGGS